jgi:predicted DNA-binding WGR domain protein
MDNLLTVAFEGHHAGKNHHRRYEVTVDRDLFDDWTVAVRYGRIGWRGQERRYTSPKPEEMRAVIRSASPASVSRQADRLPLLDRGPEPCRRLRRPHRLATQRCHVQVLCDVQYRVAPMTGYVALLSYIQRLLVQAKRRGLDKLTPEDINVMLAT